MKEVGCKCKAAPRRFRKAGAEGGGGGGAGAGVAELRKQGRDCNILGVKFGNLLDHGQKIIVSLYYWIQLWNLNGIWVQLCAEKL
jgi:hypothetical protein